MFVVEEVTSKMNPQKKNYQLVQLHVMSQPNVAYQKSYLKQPVNQPRSPPQRKQLEITSVLLSLLLPRKLTYHHIPLEKWCLDNYFPFEMGTFVNFHGGNHPKKIQHHHPPPAARNFTLHPLPHCACHDARLQILQVSCLIWASPRLFMAPYKVKKLQLFLAFFSRTKKGKLKFFQHSERNILRHLHESCQLSKVFLNTLC